MMISDEEKRWIVVGIAMNKVAAPVLRDAIKQGMDTNYANLDRHCQLLTPPCTLTTLNHGLVRADPFLRNLKFQNINNNHLVHGVCNYNFNIYSSVDLAKLYLPGYLAQFSAFDESLDMTAILRLLGFKNYMPAPVFSPHTQALADDVRENVRNKWGHVDFTEWTAARFNDCFDKVKTLVSSLGLLAGVEKDTLDQLADWQTKGCKLIMGHAVDKDLLCLVQDEVKDLIKEYSTFKSQLNLQNKQVAELEEDFAILNDQEGRLNEHHERLDGLEFRSEEITKILERLVSFEEHSRVLVQALEERVYRLEQSHTETTVKVEEVGLELKSLKAQIDKPEASSLKIFDLKSCRSKLEDHYRKTATIPTSVWSKKSVVDIHQIYTRLSWVKEEQTPAGTTQTDLKHYCDLFKGKKNGVIPKRILVQGQTGIGKSTFVKKLLVDWVDVNNETGDEQAAILKNFDLVVAINLKEVSKCQSFKGAIRLSNVFAKEDKYMTEGLVDYIANNQEKVLLIFDGYDEYRSGCDSEIYEIFSGNSLRNCCVLITTRISKSDELRGGEDLQAEITGFSEVDRNDFMLRFLSADEVSNLKKHLRDRKLEELAKVPLLLLFFCILWRKGQLKLFPKTKTTLYIEIVQFIVNHSYSKKTPPLYVQVTSLKKILSEIGKVALQALLKDDHLFEYSQLSDSVRCDESVLIGLLQITEYSETLQPIGMVSFIHKSIQEFLAAWYITYRCIPEGGNLGEIGGKLEECLALENVFQFVCGLSEDGASTALRHLKSVRISDPSLDMSKAIPDFENESDAPPSDVTERQCKFRDLVVNSYEEVESKAKLSKACLDCLGSILLSPRSESFPKDLLLKAQHEKSWSVIFELTNSLRLMKYNVLALKRTLETLVTESSEILKITDFVRKFCFIYLVPRCLCGFLPVVCFRNDQVHFYITHLDLVCNDHARLFVDFAVPSNSEHLSSGQLCLKFLKTVRCSSTRFSFEGLGEIIKHCNHLERLQVLQSDDTSFHILEQVANPRKCSLSINKCALTSKGAQKLAFLLPRFENVTEFGFCLVNCSEEAAAYINHESAGFPKLTPSDILLMSSVDEALSQSLPKLSALKTLSISSLADDEFCDGTATSLYAAIKHKTLTELTLSEILLTSPVAEALGQSLPELSALQALSMSGLINCSDQAVTSLVAAIKHKTLERLKLRRINLTSAAAKALSQSLPELSALRSLKIGNLDECSDDSVTRLFAAIANKALEKVKLRKMKLTSAAAEALGRSLPELPALKEVRVSGSDGCSLQHEEMIEAMFGKFKRPFPLLIRLKICNFSARGTLAQLTRNLCFFPSLCHLDLEALDMGEADLCSVLDNLKFIPNLCSLSLRGNPLGQAVRLMVPYLLNQQRLGFLHFQQGDCSEKHLNYVREALKATKIGCEIEANRNPFPFPRDCSGTGGRCMISLWLIR